MTKKYENLVIGNPSESVPRAIVEPENTLIVPWHYNQLHGKRFSRIYFPLGMNDEEYKNSVKQYLSSKGGALLLYEVPKGE